MRVDGRYGFYGKLSDTPVVNATKTEPQAIETIADEKQQGYERSLKEWSEITWHVHQIYVPPHVSC